MKKGVLVIEKRGFTKKLTFILKVAADETP